MQKAMGLGRVSLAVVLVVSVSSAVLARDTGSTVPSTKGRTGSLHSIGFNAPQYSSDIRTGKDQPYTWPVGDRYHPVSKPFYGRSY
ncbi:hypothetical protein [Methylobacterium sp. J-077]|uniref:hypothetical protein n=1 Tax=Methylobacterium sp. J-077 TaxID=2836656 RepID=UPI001FBBDA47|nr:hypothetical protein [Methylobacterium sp. J-077]MCJ2121850.1 hypothetical protein [Methylobacterium sp. J-077]